MELVQLNTISRQNVASEVIHHQTADVTKKLSNTTPSISAIPCEKNRGVKPSFCQRQSLSAHRLQLNTLYCCYAIRDLQANVDHLRLITQGYCQSLPI